MKEFEEWMEAKRILLSKHGPQYSVAKKAFEAGFLVGLKTQSKKPLNQGNATGAKIWICECGIENQRSWDKCDGCRRVQPR